METKQIKDFWRNSLYTYDLSLIKTKVQLSPETETFLQNVGLPVENSDIKEWFDFHFTKKLDLLRYQNQYYVVIGYLFANDTKICLDPETDQIFIIYDYNPSNQSAREVLFLNSNLKAVLDCTRFFLEMDLDELEDQEILTKINEIDPNVLKDPETSFWALNLDHCGVEIDD